MSSEILRQCRLPTAVILALLCGCSESQEIAADEPTPSSEQKQSEQQRINRLAGESSPYLLLHAHNPVDWYPWGPEAFEKAKREKKPIFLSIGYSSCHWCHVMERKVFSNEKIAEYMNKHFVNIKVDREERPDVDDVYMTSLQVYFQAIGSPQGGGWPLSMFLTPEGKPFAGGTYFPPEDETVEVDVTPPGGGAPEKRSVVRTGFATVMRKVHEAWTENRDGIEQTAAILTRGVQRMMKPGLSLTEVKLERELVDGVIKALLDSYDPVHGGIDFSPARPTAPKFPVPAKLALLQYAARNGNEQAAKVVTHTLDSVAAGGIHDHLGGGFHRYSTDRAWHVPHFEKMLYDQAQLADVYIDAYSRTGNERYRKVVEDIFRFLFREMTDPSGGFHSALDAQTDGVEGKYYVWSIEEVMKILGREDAELFGSVYGMEEEQVFEHGYVLHLPRPLDEAAADLKTTAPALEARLAEMRARLLEARQQRKPLLKDDKILTSWSGLTIRALANAGRVLENEKYTQTAERAATFLLDRLRDEKGRLLRTFRGDEAKLNAYLDDYAFLTAGLLALYEATGERKWLDAARDLTDRQIEHFRDEKGKAFFFTSHGHEELIARTKNAYDSVIPSGNSTSARNLIRLAALTGDENYRRYAEETLKVFAGDLDRSPTGMANMALAIAEFLDDRESLGKDDGKTSALPGRSRDELQTVIFRVAEEPADDSDSDEEKKKTERVQAAAHLSVDRLPAGRSCRIVILLEIKEAWHINANPVKPEFLIPTVFSIQSKQGVELKGVEYPKSKPFRVEGFNKPLAVYEGNVAIYGVLEIPAEVAAEQDEMELRIRYQACNEFQCLPPKTVKLKGKLPIARPGEPVKRINQKYFDKFDEDK